jgi:2-polyprenyl-6-methoxyphenol hydroxylase-like FAD-dependent oxidoreductase
VGYSNGLTGETLKEQSFAAVIPKYRGQRVRRTRLQAALIAKVPEGVIKLRKRLSSLTDLGEEGARLVFEDGEEVITDLVIGGDGIRSVCFSFLLVFVANWYVIGRQGKYLSRPCYSIHRYVCWSLTTVYR